MISTTLLLNLALLAVTPTELLMVNLPARGKVELSLGVKGKVDVERRGTVTRAEVRLDEIPLPQSVLAGMNTYVVWAVSPEGLFENLGELELSRNRGTLEATTKFDRLAILVTLEPHYMVDRPSFAAMYKNEAARSHRTVPVSVEIGIYEYPDLPGRADPLTPSLAIQARAAVMIAAAANAESLAMAEYRQARVSLDTMEELLGRGSAEEVVATAAREAIRRGYRAFVAARQTAR